MVGPNCMPPPTVKPFIHPLGLALGDPPAVMLLWLTIGLDPGATLEVPRILAPDTGLSLSPDLY